MATTKLLSDGCALHQAGRLPEAANLYRQVLAIDPGCIDALHLLGLILHQQKNLDDAIPLVSRAAQLAPCAASIHSNLGELFRAANRLDEAIASYRTALSIKPNLPATQNNLGLCLHRRGNLRQAAECFEHAIAGGLKTAGVHLNLGQIAFEQGNFPAALASFQHALAVSPHDPTIHFNLANAHRAARQFDPALARYADALALRPDFPEALLNQGHTFKDLGRLDEAIHSFRQALMVRPDFDAAWHSLLYAILYHPDYDEGAIYEVHARWNRERMPAAPVSASPLADASPRKLRIGYVSPDFRQHPVALNLLPLLRNHNHADFEIICYSDTRSPDGLTEIFRTLADEWIDISELNDDALTQRITANRIDILIDLALHSSHNRLAVFARKPAPLQLSFAGYPGTTGLTTIDFRLSDPHLDRTSREQTIYSERTLRLTDTFWCYEPTSTVPVGPLPALHHGGITFGSLNNFCKVNDATLALWADVLRAVPRSSFFLLAPEGSARHRTLATFARHNITPDRIEFADFAPREEYLRLYHRIDIGLDTLPYNGHTTSLDSAWMGVPVVTLLGSTVSGRAGASQLMNLGLPELIARNPESFVHIAQSLAMDIPRLQLLRGTLRERMEKSPLMDGARYAQAVEEAYRAVWSERTTSATLGIASLPATCVLEQIS